jgi:hypothetical protein
MDFGSTFESFSFSGESENCYGLEIVKTALGRKGVTVREVDYTTVHPVLVSLYWPEQLYNFIRWRYSHVMRNKKVIVGGNYPTTSPAAVAPFCDAIYLGDGDGWDGRDDSFIAVKGSPRKRSIAPHISPYLYEDLQQSRRSFVEISRGCKNKCLFCQYGWLKPYRECDYQDIAMNIDRARTKSVRVFAADRFQHSAYNSIRGLMEKRGKADTGSDVSIKFLLKHPEYLKYTNKVRVGIEGLSYRLRKMVGKDYDDSEVVRFCTLVADAGIKSLDWYMIYGLPTETERDVEHFKKLLIDLNREMPQGYTIAIHWNAFTPSAQTPFQWARPATGSFPALREMLTHFHDNDRIKIYHKPKMTGFDTLLKRMFAIRSTEATAKLAFNFANKMPDFLRHPDFLLSEYRRATGADLMDEWPTEKQMPWDDYCLYERDVMLKLYRKVVISENSAGKSPAPPSATSNP